MAKDVDKQISSRWTADVLARLELLSSIDRAHPFRSRALPPSPFGITSGGRVDYRGYPLRQLISFEITGADFSDSKSPRNEHGVDTGVTLASCLVKESVFDRTRVISTVQGVFVGSSFRYVRSDHPELVGRFDSCNFEGANLRDVTFAGNFKDCSFTGADLRGGSWSGVAFESCSFLNAKVDADLMPVKDAISAAPRVTFSVLVGGGVRIGEVVQFVDS